MQSASVSSFTELPAFISSNMKSLMNSKQMSDVIFQVSHSPPDITQSNTNTNTNTNNIQQNTKCKIFFGIRALFAIHSPVFQSMLYGNMLESKSNLFSKPLQKKINRNGIKNEDENEMKNEIETKNDFRNDNNSSLTVVIINDIHPQTFNFIQEFFYGLNPFMNCSNVVGILQCADKYLIEPLKSACIKYIVSIDINENCNGFLKLLISLNEYQLNNYILLIMNQVNINDKQTAEDILHDPLLMQLSMDGFENFVLKSGKFNELIYKEKLWVTCLKWVKVQEKFTSKFTVNSPPVTSLEDNEDEDILLPYPASPSLNSVLNEKIPRVLPTPSTTLGSISIGSYENSCSPLDITPDDYNTNTNSNSIESVLKRFSSQSKLLLKHFLIYFDFQQMSAQFFLDYILPMNILDACDMNFILSVQIRSTLHIIEKHCDTSHLSDEELTIVRHHHYEDAMDHIKFNVYPKKYITVTDDYTRIRTKGEVGICQTVVCVSDHGLSIGIHRWAIKSHDSSAGYNAIGIVSQFQRRYDSNHKIMDFYVSWPGYVIVYYTNGDIDYRQNGKRVQAIRTHTKWTTDDTITVVLDCIQWKISFHTNGMLVGEEIQIPQNITYYPTLRCCTCAGHDYEVIS